MVTQCAGGDPPQRGRVGQRVVDEEKGTGPHALAEVPGSVLADSDIGAALRAGGHLRYYLVGSGKEALMTVPATSAAAPTSTSVSMRTRVPPVQRWSEAHSWASARAAIVERPNPRPRSQPGRFPCRS